MSTWMTDLLNSQQITKMVKPEHVCAFTRSSDIYNTNRDRLAVVIGEGFGYYDTYRRWQPYLFWGSVLFSAANIGMLWHRARKTKTPEAVAVYFTGAMVGAAGAYVTNPYGANAPAPVPAGTPAEDAGGASFVGWIDEKAAKARLKNPKFADEVISRFVGIPGVKEQWDKADPTMRSFVICES